jgi:hypothetical protein
VFTPTTHNMIYHTDECCKRATNARIMKRYHERKAARKGARRICKTPNCGTLLSRYNESKYCGPCEHAAEENRNKDILKLLVS